MPESQVLTIVIAVIGLLLVASAAAIGLKRLHLPFTVGLVILGIALGSLAERVEALEPLRELTLSPELILFVFLPTLIFESAYSLDGRLLTQNLAPILTLAGPGLVLSTFVVGGLITWLTPLGWGPALVFGALISATDPVAVVALFKEVGAPKRLGILVEGESLFNDATAIVLFAILLGVVTTGAFSGAVVLDGLVNFVVVFAGGLLVGAFIGYLMLASLRWAEDTPVVEVTISTVVAYAAFIIADHYLEVSGVMATLGAGLVIGTYGSTRFTEEIKSYLHRFWEYAAFVANSLIFLLVGLNVHLESLRDAALPIAVAVLVVLVARALIVFGFVSILNRVPRVERIESDYQAVLFWGGLKGAVALALALSLPEGFANRELILALTLGVVLATLLGGGLTTGPLIGVLGLNKPSLVARVARAQSWLAAKQEAKTRLQELGATGHYSGQLLQRLSTDYDAQIGEAKRELDALRAECELSPELILHVLWAEALSTERTMYRQLFDHGSLSEPVLRELELNVDLERDRLNKGELPGVRMSAEPYETKLAIGILGVTERLAPRSRMVERFRRRALASKYETESAVLIASQRVTDQLDRLSELTGADASVTEKCRNVYEVRARESAKRLDSFAEHFPEYVQAVQAQMARRIALEAEVDAVEELASQGGIPESVAQSARAGVIIAQRNLARQPLEALEPNPEKLLKRVPLFAQLDADSLATIVTRLSPKTVLADKTILRQGERGDSLFLVARGVLAVLSEASSGDAKRVASLHTGDFFGEMALLGDEVRTATVRAVTDCRLFELRKADVLQLCQAYDGIKQALEEAALERAAKSQERARDD